MKADGALASPGETDEILPTIEEPKSEIEIEVEVENRIGNCNCPIPPRPKGSAFETKFQKLGSPWTTRDEK